MAESFLQYGNDQGRIQHYEKLRELLIRYTATSDEDMCETVQHQSLVESGESLHRWIEENHSTHEGRI